MKPTIHKFDVIVNPFIQSIQLSLTIKKAEHTLELSYTDSDEWVGFELAGMNFDLHVHYDDDFSISIYDVVLNEERTTFLKTETSYWHKVNLFLELKEGKIVKYKDVVKHSSKISV